MAENSFFLSLWTSESLVLGSPVRSFCFFGCKYRKKSAVGEREMDIFCRFFPISP